MAKRISNRKLLLDERKERENDDEWSNYGSNVSGNEKEIARFWDSSEEKSFQTYNEFFKNDPQQYVNKLQKVNTLRVQKIQHIMSDSDKIQGVKFVDLHLLNMTK